MSELYSIEVTTNTGSVVPMADYQGQVLLIVNTASACGFTSQYQGLQELFERYKDRGFQVLAFPCNQFGNQEKGDDEAIRQFCDLNFNVSFTLFHKIDVNGPRAHPLYRFLSNEKRGVLGSKAIKWNFTKFLIDRQGQVFQRYAPTTKPEQLVADIETLLGS